MGTWEPGVQGAIESELRGKCAQQPGTRVLIVMHRVALCSSAMADYLAQIGFQLYSDVTTNIETATRLVICVDSLWKVENRTWDLVAVDEITEVIKQMCSLKTKAPGSGRWAVWSTLREMFANAPRIVLMSAQADETAKKLLGECGVSAHWRQNAEPLLSHMRCSFFHSDHPESGYGRLIADLDEGGSVVVPCAEQEDPGSKPAHTVTELASARQHPENPADHHGARGGG